MSAISTSMNGVLDRLLDQLQRRRERVMAEAASAERATRIAELYEREARAWSLVFERSRSRLYWRAALSAEAYARACARTWRARAATEALQDCAGDKNLSPALRATAETETWTFDAAGGAA